MMDTGFRLTEQDYQYLFDNASDAIWVHDMEGNLLGGNKAAERLTAYAGEELVGMNAVAFLTPESLETARKVRRKLLDGEDFKQPYEQRLVRKDGAIRIVKMATSLLVIDGSPISSFVVDKEHKITHWNTAIAALSGISGEKMVGTDRQWQAFYAEKRPTMADLIVDGASADEIEAYYRDKYKKSRLIVGAYEAEDFFPDLGENGKWLHFTASPIKNESGQIVYAIETLADVSEAKQLQESMRFYVQLITRAQEEERKRIARELHDDVSSSLLILIQRLDRVASGTRPKLSLQLKTSLEDLRQRAVETLEGVRRYAQDLRPRILDDLGLIAALEWMAEDLTKNDKIEARVEIVGNQPNLPAETQLLLFRIAQQALSNVRRHSAASVAVARLEFESSRIKMTISDNGKGFELPGRAEELASRGKLGIAGMQERARLLGGSLEIRSEFAKGTHVIVEVPLPA